MSGYPPPYPGAPPPYGQPYPMGSVPPPGAAGAVPGYGSGPQPYPPAPAGPHPYPPAPAAERPPKEFCFVIENVTSRLVLEVEGASVDPGARVVTAVEKKSDSQLWYEDSMTGTIRSRLNMMCMQVNAYNTVALYPYAPGDSNQQWLRSRERIQNRQDQNKVLMAQSYGPNSPLMASTYHSDARQVWTSRAFVEDVSGAMDKMSLAPKPVHYFFIRSDFNSKVLDVDAGSTAPGTKAILWPQKSPPADNQLWYLGDDGIIRSKLTNFVLEPSYGAGSPMVMRPFEWKPDQSWIYDGRTIRTQNDVTRCVEIQGGNPADGATVCTNRYNGGATQHWTLEYIGNVKPQPRPAPPRIRYFFIRSVMHGKVLDVDGGNPKAGTKAIMWPRKPHSVDNQLWYLDPSGIIRSKLTNFALENKCGSIRLENFTGRPGQLWVIRGQKIVLQGNTNMCLDIVGESRADGAPLCQYAYKASANQHWAFDYTS